MSSRSEFETRLAGLVRRLSVVATMACLALPVASPAAIEGLGGLGQPGTTDPRTFNLTARADYISVADGGSIYMWGYAQGQRGSTNRMQLPGPTLKVRAGTRVTINLDNALPTAAGNVSIVLTGHNLCAGTLQADGVTCDMSAATGVAGVLAQEATPGGRVTYTFIAPAPGTYQYHSGTRPDLQIEMGLYGALIVYPADYAVGNDNNHPNRKAYSHSGTTYDREYLFLLSEIDADVHHAAELQAAGTGPIDVGSPPFHPEYWLMNGRAGPDTMAEKGTSGLLPTQPYNALPRMHPGERILMRVIGAGHDMHPFHHHGNHSQVLARDGRLLVSETDATKLAGPRLFTIPSVPGGTVDAIFEWTGQDLGWDIYGTGPGYAHSCTPAVGSDFDATTHEYCPDHNKPIPVNLPDLNNLAFGGFWSGSPYLGTLGALPPGEGGLNPNAGYTYMWHSHTERELVNNDVFPGGMMTMLIIEPPSAPIIE